MTYLYSVDWKKVPLDEFLKLHQLPLQHERRRRHQHPNRVRDPVLDNPNMIAIRVTCLDELGDMKYITKLYEDWLGVCTNDIDSLVKEMKTYLPGIVIRYEKLHSDTKMLHKRVLPYFPEKLKSGQLLDTDEGCPFYKMYMDCAVEEVGQFFRRHEIAYYQKCDWSVRLYIDLCTRFKSEAGFFYKWYRVDPASYRLVEAFLMCRTDSFPPPPPMVASLPNWRVAAFDIETVPGPEASFDRVPDGTDPNDRIVMISIVMWNDRGTFSEEKVLYLNPIAMALSKKKKRGRMGNIKLHLENPKYLEYESESDLLNDFHYFIRECHVLTGYNVNNFDFPCIFSRLLFLKRFDLLTAYTSRSVGDYRIITYANKIVLDLYHYFRIFSNYDLSSFKLDKVAEKKLGGDPNDDKNRKIAVDSVGIHAWYNGLAIREDSIDETVRLCRSIDNRECYEALVSPKCSSRMPTLDRFGTFPEYVKYCLRDSQLVQQLFLKETVLSFLIARSDFAALDVVQSMHYGNSRFLLEVFRSYGTMLGFFINIDYLENRTDGKKYEATFDKGTYQGALNYCLPETYFEDVVVLDFTSMYPISLLSTNLCYGTCDILTRDEYAQLEETVRQRLTTIPYRTHSNDDFVNPQHETYHHQSDDGTYEFRYPTFDPEKDAFVIVVDRTVQAFLPTIVKHFLDLRKYHQCEWKRTRNVVHYNSQLCIKLLINSMYGTMASKDSPLAYIVVAMAIVALARYQLLGSFHYIQDILGYTVCYADTDSLMVHKWPYQECDIVNRFLGTLPYVELKFEERMLQLLVLSKKRYVYKTPENEKPVTKGFQKKVNELVRFMSDKFVEEVLRKDGNQGNSSVGWGFWVDVLLEGLYMCRDPRKYAVTRKTRKLSEYVSKSCPAVKMLKKYPEKEGDYIDYTFSRADVGELHAGEWVMSVTDCQYVNFEKLFVNQKKIFYTIFNIGFWKLKDPKKPCDAVLNTIHWRYFVHAELLYYNTTGKKFAILIEKGIRYTFRINDHCFDTTVGAKRNSSFQFKESRTKRLCL